MNTHEQFITPKTARLAREAGFDWESRFDNQQQRDEWQQVALVEVSNPDYNDAMGAPYSDEFIPFMSPTMFVMCPHVTQSVLQRWLREAKNIVLLVDFDNDEDCDENERYGVTIYIGNERIVELATYPIYEAALEAGLQRCLTLIIDNL
jgi:hypothetical protein